MKKLLSILLALVISLTMVSGVSATLISFDIQTYPGPIMAGEEFQIEVIAWDENNYTITDFTQLVSLGVGLNNYNLDLVNGTGTTNKTALAGSFDITADHGTVSSTITRFGEDYDLIVSDTQVDITATTNDTGYVAESMTLTNEGNMNLTDVSLSCSGSYAARCSFSPSSTYSISANGDYKNLIFGFDVTSLTANTHKLDIVISATGIEDIIVPVDVVVSEPSEEEILYIDEVKINGEKIDLDEYNSNEDLTIEAKDIIGEDIEVEITIKNDGDEDIEDVDVDLVIEEIDNGDDIEDEDRINRIKDGDEDTITFIFSASSIDWDADEDTYTITIDIEGDGRDSNDLYKDSWNFDMEIEKESDDIEITKAEFDYSEVEPGQMAYLEIELTNIGENDQDEIVLVVKCDDLDVDFLEKNLDIDEGDDETITFSIDVSKYADFGSYSFDITAYYDWGEYKNEDLTDADKVTLTVEGEAEEEEEEEEYVPEGSVIIVPEETIPSQVIPTTEEISFRETTAYTTLLVLGSVLLMAMIVFLLVQVFKR